jgi:Ca2+-binding RTX toxin-like protein
MAAADRGIFNGSAITKNGFQGGFSMAIFSGDGTANTLSGTASDDTIFGLGGNDDLSGLGGNDTLEGGVGDDMLRGGVGADILRGGDGIDTANFEGAAGVSVAIGGLGIGGNAAGDLITTDIENLQGTLSFADTLTGSDVANVLSGYGGDDTLVGLGGNDTLDAGAGNDLLDGGAGADVLNGGAGIDTIVYVGAPVTVTIGGIGAGGDAQGDMIGADIENIRGTDGGNDHLTGSAAANILTGLGSDDLLRGLAGNDTLDGGAGIDFLVGGAGADVLIGGAAIDTVDYTDSAAGVTVRIGGTGSGGDAQGDTIGADIENIQGSWDFNDVLIGSEAANTLTGFGGNDLLIGQGGDDTLNGAGGDDELEGGAGADHLNAGTGPGIDTVAYATSQTGVTVNLTTLTASGGDAQGDQFGAGAEFENIRGSASADTLTGNALANVLTGGGGNDVLRGVAGADHLDGGDGTDFAMYSESSVGVTVNLATGIGSGGNAQGDTLVSIEGVYGGSGGDTLTGDAGANTLVGNGGDDVIQGGAGRDSMASGDGADRFVYVAAGDSTVAAADRITDFSHAQGDRIDLGQIDANTAVAGNQAFSFIGSTVFTHHAGELRFASAGGVTVVSGDVDGDGTADVSIVLTGTIALVAADFVL